MACISTQIFTGYSLWSHGSEAAVPLSVNEARSCPCDPIASTGSETEVVNLAPTSSDFIRIEA
jgi:hypothetical protein